MAFFLGTPNDDVFHGTGASDTFDGWAGNDTFFGGGGLDIAGFWNSPSEFRIEFVDGYVQVTDIFGGNGDLGTDKLVSVERLDFSGASYSIATRSSSQPQGQVQVNSVSSDYQCVSSVTALADGGYVVTWQSMGQDGWGMGIYARRYDALGNAIGAETRVNTTTMNDQIGPAITSLANGGYIITWGSSGNVFSQRFDANGNSAGAETFITTGIYPDAVTSLADGGYVITVMRDNTIFANRFNANGQVVGGETIINVGFPAESYMSAATGLDGGGYVMTWLLESSSNTGRSIYAQRFDANGNAAGTATLVNSAVNTNSTPAITSLEDGGYVITWISSDKLGIYVRRFDASGNTVGPAENLVSPTKDAYELATTALESGGYAVVWSSGDGRLHTQSFDASGNSVGDEFRFDPPGPSAFQLSVAGIEDGSYIVTWTIWDNGDEEIFSRRFDARGEPFKETALEIKGTLDHNTILCGKGEQWLYGLDGNDTLSGGRNGDVLNGGHGNDKLSGGKGADTFVLIGPAPYENIDLIKDFSANDIMQLDRASFSGLRAGPLSAAKFVANASGEAVDANDRIVYETDTGKLFYDYDGSGAAAKVQLAQIGVQIHFALTADYFVVV